MRGLWKPDLNFLKKEMGECMIQKMQSKFVATVMAAFLILTGIVAGSINLFGFIQTIRRYDQMLEILISNNGEFPEPEEFNKKITDDFGHEFEITVETRFESRYFLVSLDSEGNYLDSDISHIAAVSGEDVFIYAEKVFKELKPGKVSKGTCNLYRYRLEQTNRGYEIAFIDMTQQMANLENIRTISVMISAVLLVLLMIIVSFLSKRAIRPMVETMEKQKRFITDAGHELKTPLAVISANADVLELTGGKNEWIESIRNQTKQMDVLVKRLLFLSKMEEGEQMVFAEFDLSKAVLEKVSQLSTIAYSSEKEFETDIAENIHYKGDMTAIEHLVSVLTENAIKYCSEKGKIQVKLYKSGKTIHFEVRNEGDPLEASEMSRLFERFYRPDSSRSKNTGGHGIGLSIAKAVVTAHKGRIYVKNEKNNVVAFCVEL
ncbi:MAG: HAMP domain-containing histidine kinase [Lachnospiraceae bacterium]